MTIPTSTDLTTRFPAFADVDPTVLDHTLAEAAIRVDPSWTPGDYPLGVLLYAAHVLTLDGFGTGAEAALAAAGALGFQIMRSGSLHLEREVVAHRHGRRTAARTNQLRPALSCAASRQPASRPRPVSKKS